MPKDTIKPTKQSSLHQYYLLSEKKQPDILNVCKKKPPRSLYADSLKRRIEEESAGNGYLPSSSKSFDDELERASDITISSMENHLDKEIANSSNIELPAEVISLGYEFFIA